MRDYAKLWHGPHYTVIFVPVGEIPQTRGSWGDMEPVIQMLDFLKGDYPEGTLFYVATSLSGELSVETAADWLFSYQVMSEWIDEEEVDRG